MNVKVKQATITSGMFLSYKYDVTISDVTNTNGTKSDAVIHDDLKDSFRNLIPFFAHICEEIVNENEVLQAIEHPEVHLIKVDQDDVKPFLKYRVTSFTIAGKKDGEGVTLDGVKYLDNGNSVGFSTPFTKFDGDYKFAPRLLDAIEVAKNEVFEYMQGKQAPKSQQLGVFDGVPDDDDSEDDKVF